MGQVGKFLLPKPGQKAIYETNEEMYWHIGEDDVSPPDQSFNLTTVDPGTLADAEDVPWHGSPVSLSAGES